MRKFADDRRDPYLWKDELELLETVWAYVEESDCTSEKKWVDLCWGNEKR